MHLDTAAEGKSGSQRTCRTKKSLFVLTFDLKFLNGPGHSSRTKSQPKEEVFGTDIPRTSGVIRADIPTQNFGQGGQNPGKQAFGADIHDPKARTSTTLREFQKLRPEKLWAEFSFPNSALTLQGLACGYSASRDDYAILGETLTATQKDPAVLNILRRSNSRSP